MADMIPFKELPISRTIKQGTSLACLIGRTAVCKAKKEFAVIGQDENSVLVEQGSEVICGYSDNKAVFLTNRQWIKEIASSDLIENPALLWSYRSCLYETNLQELAENLEFLDDETKQLEHDVKQLMDMHKQINEINHEICEVEIKSGDAAARIECFGSPITFIAGCWLSFNLADLLFSNRTGAIIIICLFLAIFGVACLMAFVESITYLLSDSEDGNYFEWLTPRWYKNKIELLNARCQKLLEAHAYTLELFRKRSDWATSTNC
jgi:hypothetical protein